MARPMRASGTWRPGEQSDVYRPGIRQGGPGAGVVLVASSSPEMGSGKQLEKRRPV